MKKVAVVILNWNGKKFLHDLLPTLIQHTPADVDIVVGDNASTDGSVEFLQQQFPQIKIIQNDKNYGFAEGYNKVLSQVDTDYYVLLNSDVEVTANWIIVDIQAYLNKEAITIYNFPISPKRLADLVNMIESKEISNKQGREIFTYMLTHDVTASEGKKELGISSQISDEDTIRALVNEVLDANAQSIVDFKAGKDRALGFMIGQVMRKSGGKVNPSLTNKIMLEEIGRR